MSHGWHSPTVAPKRGLDLKCFFILMDLLSYERVSWISSLYFFSLLFNWRAILTKLWREAAVILVPWENIPLYLAPLSSMFFKTIRAWETNWWRAWWVPVKVAVCVFPGVSDVCTLLHKREIYDLHEGKQHGGCGMLPVRFCRVPQSFLV